MRLLYSGTIIEFYNLLLLTIHHPGTFQGEKGFSKKDILSPMQIKNEIRSSIKRLYIYNARGVNRKKKTGPSRQKRNYGAVNEFKKK